MKRRWQVVCKDGYTAWSKTYDTRAEAERTAEELDHSIYGCGPHLVRREAPN